MTRDELARHLYIHSHDEAGPPPPFTLEQWQDQGAKDWDDGKADPTGVQIAYRHADQHPERSR